MPTWPSKVDELHLLWTKFVDETRGGHGDMTEHRDSRYEENLLKAMKVLAEDGAASAQHNFGVVYFNGLGVPQDYVEAMKWFRKAAEQSYAEAQFNVGVMYENGHGAARDYVQAHQWFNLAAAHFPASEGESRARAVESRDRVASKMTRAQIAEAQSLAREWKRK